MSVRLAAGVGCAIALLALAVGPAGCRTVEGPEAPEARPAALPRPRVTPTVTAGRWPRPPSGAPARVLLVSIAGLTPDRYLEGRSTMPVLSQLAREGIAGEALVPVRPDTPFPVHATLVTGQPPAVHGIVADRLIGERGVQSVRFWHASRLTAPTLWDRARERGLEVVALDWPSTVGAGIAWLLPALDPVRENDTWLALERQTASPRLFAAVMDLAPKEASAPGSRWPDPTERDALVAEVACRLAAVPDPPRLWMLRLVGPDPVLRERGPRHPDVDRAFGRADAELGRILDCFAGADLLATSAVVVVGDRALEPVHTALEPNRWLAEAGLVDVSGDGRDIVAWRALSRSNGGSAFVYARDAAAAIEAKEVLSASAALTRSFRVVPATELQAFRSDPQAWFGLEAARGFAFGDAVDRPPIHAAADRAAAGHLTPDRVAPAGFAAWGQGLRRGVTAPEVYVEDVGPTVAALLGLGLGEVDGRLMIGLIEPRPVAPPVSTGAEEAEP